MVNPSEYSLPKFEFKEIKSWPVSAVDGRRVRLQLKAPRRGNGGSAYRYAVRYQEGSIAVNKDSWKSMTEFEKAYIPVSPEQWQEFDVIGLTPAKHYTFAVRAVDEQGRMSDDILVTENDTKNDPKTFVTVSPTGRSLMLSDGTPFVLVGETGLMPWLPLRGLYPGKLCDEHPADFFLNPPTESKWPLAEKCGIGKKNKKGEDIVGIWRNYSTERVFYYCHFNNGETGGVALLEPSDTDPTDNCEYQESRKLAITNPTEPVEGAGVAERYFQKLKANGVNVITVFVESLDLDASPILLDAQQDEVIGFLDNVLNLARQNDVYVLFRLYDTFYYKDDNFKTVGRKWSDTSWAKSQGATHPDDFFEKKLYDSHKERMKPLLHRYRDDPNVFGWDIVNEIDNKERFNTASYEKRKDWLTEMARFVQQEDSNHLVFYSFLTWDPKDDTFYRASIGATSNEISVKQNE
ncbi:MAG: cellulase family glycosylhydrolase [Thiotrichaceae bacterium]